MARSWYHMNMNRLAATALAVAVSLGAILSAVPARAATLYPIRIETKGQPAYIVAYAPTNTAIRMSVSVPANATKSYALEAADYYEFKMTICGKTHTSRWNRGGAGVTLLVSSCDSYSFTMQR
jgi:redox-regulated HSP33 family molecular chaperone